VHRPDTAQYYVSLGDSLAVGFEPDSTGVERPTTHGFDHDLLALNRYHHLRLTELGCPGETTATMIDGGGCSYPKAKSQLDAAVAFLKAHRGHVALVTVTIGANDVENCATAAGIDATCVQRGFAAIRTNLPNIVSALRQADPHSRTRFVGLNEYDPFLAAFLQGQQGQQLADQSAAVVDQLNGVLATAYTGARFRVADVSSAFRTDDFTDQATLPGVGQVPVNVANICAYTFECTPPPVGPNIHPQDSGYRVMAEAVTRVS
jgi:lysophospholipase L1-like esterase